MTQKEKALVIKDLSMRLPYGVICNVTHKDGRWKTEDMKLSGVFNEDSQYFTCESGSAYSSTFKPYLRPMSSMTEEELRDFAKIKFEDDALWEIVGFPKKDGFKGFINVICKNKNSGDTWIFQVNTRTPLETYYGIDWLNAHHFDFRGLIEKGLALKAPEDMYKEN